MASPEAGAAKAGASESGASKPAVHIDAFVGSYAGTLHVADGGQVPMTLEVAPMRPVGDAQGRRFHWRLRYADQPLRDYVLCELDRDAGCYEIDEQNGIVLPAVFRRGELVSVFQVGSSLLNVRYRLGDGGVQFALESVDTTGGHDAGGGARGYSRVAVQRPVLRRQ